MTSITGKTGYRCPGANWEWRTWSGSRTSNQVLQTALDVLSDVDAPSESLVCDYGLIDADGVAHVVAACGSTYDDLLGLIDQDG